METGFRRYRPRLPHWRQPDAVYHVTWRLHRDQRPLIDAERGLVVSALRHFDGRRYGLVGYAVMDDHVHVVVSTADEPLERVLHSWKSFTARRFHELGREGSIWQGESWDRIIRSDRELDETIAYVLFNPEERWPGAETYRWVWSSSDPL